MRQQRFGQRLGVLDDGVRVVLERGLRRLFQRHGQRGGGVLVRPTLQPREDRAVDGLRVLGLAQDHAAARTAQRLVGGRGDHVGVGHGRGMGTTGDQAGDVGDVGDEARADVWAMSAITAKSQVRE